MLTYRLYDDCGVLVYQGHSWEFTRRYLDYLVKTLPDPPMLVIRRD